MHRTRLEPVRILGLLMVVWLIPIAASGQVTLTTLHTLFGGTDGEYPIGGVVLDSRGNLFGTTRYGGSSILCPFLDGCGSVFEVSPDGNGGWTFQTLYWFSGGADGARPEGDLILDPSGNIYGTTSAGATINSICPQGCGTVFELSPSVNSWNLTTLYSFTGADGAGLPTSGVIRDNAGRLYGTAGPVFVLVPSKSGWTFSILYSFNNPAGGYDPYGGLTMDASGNLYGTTIFGGFLGCGNGVGCGTVFELSRSGGTAKFTVLHQFKGCAYNDGAQPMGNLVINAQGDVFGTTWIGGTACGTYSFGNGTVFRLSHATGTWREQVLHRFNVTDGASPMGDLAMDSTGVLYGTTQLAGTKSDQGGTIFMLKPEGTGWQFADLHNFSMFSGGYEPTGGVTLDASGNLFGTTQYSQALATYGTVFELSPQ